MNFEYNVEKIKSVLNDFYHITKIKTVILGSDFSRIASVPPSDCSFCTAMSQNPTSDGMCQRCTHNSLLLCQKKRALIVYTCHAGLIEAVAPIFMDDIIVGYIMLGQVLKRGSDVEKIIAYSQCYIGTEAETYLRELEDKSDDDISAAARMMQSCVCYLLINKLIKEDYGNILLELRKYIEENPTADLSSNTLCKKFAVSRNYLYKISNTYFGMPIASYVRLKRLKHAQQLIREGCSVTLAAERAGFNDYGYFGKLFKRYIGQTPLKAKRDVSK